jgi:hypothetical protein
MPVEPVDMGLKSQITMLKLQISNDQNPKPEIEERIKGTTDEHE